MDASYLTSNMMAGAVPSSLNRSSNRLSVSSGFMPILHSTMTRGQSSSDTSRSRRAALSMTPSCSVLAVQLRRVPSRSSASFALRVVSATAI